MLVRMQTVKGTSLQLTIDLVRQRHGDAGIATLWRALPEDVRAVLPPDLVVLPATSYSFRAWAELLLAAETHFGTPISIARESARSGYRRLLASTYARWVRRGDALESIKRLPHLWDQVTRGLGTYEVLESDDGPLVIRLRLAVDPRYRAITEERCAGVVEAMAEAAGGRARVRLERLESHTDLQITMRGPTLAG